MGNLETDDLAESLDIAVIGLAGRFPGAKDLDQFWQNLKNGVEAISFFTEQEVLAAGVDPAELGNPHYVKAGGVLEDVEMFDAAFFGFYPREAEIMDPQHRIFLECAWEALENAGYDPETYQGLIGVWAGAGLNTYLLHHLLASRQTLESVHPYHLTIGNDKDFLTTRVSYKLNLRGPSVNVQSACSTSLVAVHMACQGLLNYQCDMALAGGISIRLPQKSGYLYQEGGIASPDGHCRPFDAKAQGTVSGNGVGIVVLKRLADALACGDYIHAVIKSTAINNDGALKAGYTAPSIEGQAEVIAATQALSGVDPETITYLEAHGTGTALGDPIEIAALTQAFRARTEARGFCAIGSVKSNIGHLDAAAGVAGLIKTILALEHKQIPPSLNFEQPNPKIDFAASPFYVNTRLSAWKTSGTPRRAGVSSFGLGGTNAHVIVEESPTIESSESYRPWQLLLLSTRTDSALETASMRLAEHLKQHPDLNLADVAYTCQLGRRHFKHRRTVLCRSLEEAVKALQSRDPKRVFTAVADPPDARVVFMFPGQGAQYVNMARELYELEPEFRRQVDFCSEFLKPHLGLDLREVLFPGAEQSTAMAPQLAQTCITQPALFVIEYALARLWIQWGVYPQAMIGHSIGEYSAACLAGVFSLEDALRLVAARGRLMQSLPKGAMLSVSLGEAELRPLLNPELSLAAINAPSLCVVSGREEAIETQARWLARQAIACRRLPTSHAFHSEMMEPILESFASLFTEISLCPPAIPFISNLTGTWITAEQATDPNYWARHLRQTVRFADGIGLLLEDPSRILLEVGPGNTLSTLTQQHPHCSRQRIVLSSLRHPHDSQSDLAFLLGTLGRLWLAGVKIDWANFHAHERRRRLPLPTYPFERQRYWIEAPLRAGRRESGKTAEPDSRLLSTSQIRKTQLRKRPNITDWFYLPSWRRLDLPRALGADRPASEMRWLIFSDRDGLGDQLAQQLEQHKQVVVRVQAGKYFDQISDSSYTINPRGQNDYHALLRQLARKVDRIVHLWGVTPHNQHPSFDEAQDLGFYSLLFLVQALGQQMPGGRLRLGVVTTNAHEVIGGEELSPAKATISGLCQVIAQEYPNIFCQSIDLVFAPPQPNSTGGKLPDVAHQLIHELTTTQADDRPAPVIAYRGPHRWVQTFEPLRLCESNTETRLRKKGVYLITGGLGRIGLRLAEYLAQTAQAKLALLSRSTFPARNSTAQVGDRLGALQRIEALGSEVLILTSDVANREQMREAIAQTEKRFGALHGVIHAAGLASEEFIRPIQETDRALCEAHFHPKARGLMILEEALQDRELDFCLLLSSLSSVLGGVGFAAYAAANSFMDSFALRHNQTSPIPWISVNWDGWRFDEQSSPATELAITPEEGLQAFQHLFSLSEVSQLVISTADLQARAKQSRARPWRAGEGAPDASPEEKQTPAEMRSQWGITATGRNPKTETRNEIEQTICEIWQKALGIEQIGTDDNFFALGGDSLLATQIVSRLRDTFQVELPLRCLFEMPTVAGLATLIATSRSLESQAAPIPRASRDEVLPLSSAQQRLWFLDQLEPGSPLYNNAAAVRLSGRLNVAAMERSLNEIIRRHEILRTVYSAVDGQPRQVILPELHLPLPIIDLSQMPADERQDEIARLAVEEARQSFDLAQGPLLRNLLLRISETEHIALLTMHHIVSDGWSIGVFLRELKTHYEAFSAGQRRSPLGELPIQYADFARWHREWLQGEVLASQLAYWKQRLGDGELVLDLPTDRPRPAIQSFRGATQHFSLSSQLREALKDLSQQEGVTLFMLLVAAFQTLLYRYTGQEDICIGTPIAGRIRPQTEELIGCFVNTLVLRTNMQGDPSFQELLKQVREVALGAYAHQDLPFELLVEELRPERDLSRTPLFQVMFVHLNGPPEDLQLPDLTISPLPVDTGTAKFDLTLFAEEGADFLKLILNYNTDLFDEATIVRMAGHLQTLLEGIVAHPAQRLSALPLLTESERRQLLIEWNETDNHQPQLLPVHQLIEAQVERTPEAVAVVCGTATALTYQELNERANKVAHYLQKLGVGPETVVGLCVERSPEMIIGLLGILKAGGAFLPLDPSYPTQRVAFMLEDAEVRLLLTEQRWVESRSRSRGAGEQARELLCSSAPAAPLLICLDTDWATIAQESKRNPESKVTAENLAYVIYTSGSTGKPKGVLITHGAIANHCRDIILHYELTANDRVLQFATLAFDAALEQILPTLMVGARLVLRDSEVWTGHDLQQKICEESLTVVNLPPAYWQQWIQSSDLRAQTSESPPLSPAPGQLRLVIVGGDVLPAESLKVWQQSPLKQVRLLNAYGPTETTITATTYEIPAQSDSEYGTGPRSDQPQVPRKLATSRVPIGRPLANRKVYILDRHGNPVPIGVPGELYLGGAGLARGYLKRPELTEEKFIRLRLENCTEQRSDWPKSEAGVRVYKTGDLARYLPDGNIEFLGRIDDQVKVRGFRIELGEIESTLREHSAISEAVVVAHSRGSGEKQLVAFYLPASEMTPTASELRHYLKTKLPDFMVPSTFIALRALPTTASGKLDRRALAALETVPGSVVTGRRGELETNYVAPRTPLEETLTHIWAKVIGVERVGVYDNFFELGGHSLVATQLISRVRNEFQVELPLRCLFEQPTVAGLAQIISQQLAAAEDAKEMEQLLAELELLSDEEARQMLAPRSEATPR